MLMVMEMLMATVTVTWTDDGHSQNVLVAVRPKRPGAGLARLVANLRLMGGVAGATYEHTGPHALAFEELAVRLHKFPELTLLVHLVEPRVRGLLSRSYVLQFVGDVLEREAACMATQNLPQ